MVNIARRTALRLVLFGGGALSIGSTLAGTAASGARIPDARDAPAPLRQADSDEDRLWRYAGEFGGTNKAK